MLLVWVFLGIDLQASFRPSSPSFCESPSAGNCITGHSQEDRGDGLGHTSVTRAGGGVRGRRALGEGGQWFLCGTLRYTLLLVSDGAKVSAC